MNVFDLQATLGLDYSGYSAGLGAARGEANSFASFFKKIIGGIAGIAVGSGAVLAGAGVAVTKIVKNAVSAYADYEQLVGGVETLFGTGGKSIEQFAESASDSMYKLGQRGEDVLALQKELIEAGYDVGASGADGIYGPKTKAAFDAYAKDGGQLVKDAYNRMAGVSDKVIANADEAYKTAGLSANEYMETVTSFSASLIQSLGGDTDKAADMADVAIRDMSDNANKMGTDMSAIQVAYAGFAKQNYTMLDNLKLGYGGTKTEMERLIKDANKLRAAQGKTADLTISKYSDIIEAIHTIQEDMGITGTTAAEAADTIEGSLKSTKAAWKNLLISFATGKDINKRLDSLVESGKNVVKNVMPAVTTSLKSIGSFVGEIVPLIAQELPDLIAEAGPELLRAIGSLAGSIITNFPAMLRGLGSAVAEAITGDPNADFGTVAGAIITGIQTKTTELTSELKKALGLGENASWGEVANVVIKGIQGKTAELSGELKKAMGLSENADWGDVAGAIGRGIRANASTLAANLRVALGITENADWSLIGQNISDGIKSAFTTGSEFLKGLLGIEDGESIGLILGTAIQTGLNTALEGVSGTIAGALFGEDSTQAADVIESSLRSILATIIEIQAVTGTMKLGRTIAEWGESLITKISGGLESFLNLPFAGPLFAFKAGGWVMDTADQMYTHTFDEANRIAEQGEAEVAALTDSTARHIGEIRQQFADVLTSDELYNIPDGGENPLFALFKQYGDELEAQLPDIDVWGKIKDQISESMLDEGGGIDWNAMFENLDMTNLNVADFESLTQNLIDALTQAMSEAEAQVLTEENAPEIKPEVDTTEMTSQIDSAGTTSGASVGTAIEGGITAGSAAGAASLEASISAAGASAAASIAAAIQEALNSITMPTLIPADAKGKGLGVLAHYNASAMSAGHIFNKPTLFGYADGKYQVAGDAGPEAVVGVNSLNSMIQQSVENAVGAVLSRLDAIIGGQNQGDLQVVLDNGVLVGQMVRGMDKQLGKMAAWRGGGRA